MSFEVTTLGEYAVIQGGFAYKSHDFVSDSGIPVLKIKNVRHGYIDYTSTSYVSVETAQATTKWFTISGDILISMTGSGPSAPESLVGRVARVWTNEPSALINQRVGRLVPKGVVTIDPDFLFYVLSKKDTQEFLVKNSTGSANQVNISSKTIEAIPCPRVDFYESREIAAFLNAFEQRSRLLRETNATLEAIAQALFKSWFVDFDPVRAKMEGRAPEGMDEATAAFFPDGLEESALGAVPKGWNYCSLKEVTAIFDSKRIPLASDVRAKRRGPYPYYGAAALMDYVDDYLFDGVYLLTGEDGSVADKEGFPITQYVWGQIWVNNHAHVLQGKDGVSTEHVMLALQRTNITPFITGAVQAKLSQSNMWRIKLLLPTQEISVAFGSMISPLYQTLRHNSDQIQTLATLRDTLLPRLISGQLRLPDAESDLMELPA